MRKTEKGDNSVLDLPKVNQVIYTLDTIFDPNIMTQVKRFLRYFVHKLPLGYDEKKEKGDNSVIDLQNFTKS